MKYLYLIVFIFSVCFCSCNSEEEIIASVERHATIPSKLNPDASRVNDEQYAYVNTVEQKGKLLIFLGGSLSQPDKYRYFAEQSAILGYHVINLSYFNLIPAQLCDGNPTPNDCYENFHEAIIYGNSDGSSLSVSEAGSIMGRLSFFLNYLVVNFPDENWSQFLYSDGKIDFSKTTWAGHSQGAGHAVYVGYHHEVHKVIAFSGPGDYVVENNSAAEWMKEDPLTDRNKFYSFSHESDDVIAFSEQKELISIITGRDVIESIDTTDIADLSGNALSTNINPDNRNFIQKAKYHNATVLDANVPRSNGSPLWTEVWTYLLEK